MRGLSNNQRYEFSPALNAIIAINEAAAFLQNLLDRAVSPIGITGAQYAILRILKIEAPGGCSSTEILRQIIDKKADLTRQLDGLERLGFIARSRSGTDRRVVVSTITAAGIEALNRVDPLFKEMLDKLNNTLDSESWSKLANLCRSVIDS